jgi:hypothetical protein
LRSYYNANVFTEKTDEGFETRLSIAFGAHCVEIKIIDGLTNTYYTLQVIDSYGKNVTDEYFSEYGKSIDRIPCDDLTDALKKTDKLVECSFSLYQR